MNKNPIFIEHYAHCNCDCYKILNPWSRFHQETLVLCRVSEGLVEARNLAKTAILAELEAAMDIQFLEASGILPPVQEQKKDVTLERNHNGPWQVLNPDLPAGPRMTYFAEGRNKYGVTIRTVHGETNDLAYLVERLRFSFRSWDKPPHYWALMNDVPSSPFREILFEEKPGEVKPLPPRGIPSKPEPKSDCTVRIEAAAGKYEYDGVTYLDDVEPSVVVAALRELGAKGWHVVGGGPWAQPSPVSRDCHGTLTWFLERPLIATK